MEISMRDFMTELSSKAPVPGGGGASALIGAVGVSLCSMVANLTSGKKKYAEYQQDIDEILKQTSVSIDRLLQLIQKDAEVFEPLSKAYGIPKEQPDRDELLEKALVAACTVPMDILQEVYNAVDIIEQLSVKGSRIAISDVGVAASACRSAMEGAVMNVYINTKLMKNTEYAASVNAKAAEMIEDGTKRCEAIYQKLSQELRVL